jgi:hypothetical protein
MAGNVWCRATRLALLPVDDEAPTPRLHPASATDFDYDALWAAVAKRFDVVLTWSSRDYVNERRAVKAILDAYTNGSRPDNAELLDFLAFMETTWRSDEYALPTFHRYGKHFGSWRSRGRPKKEEKKDASKGAGRGKVTSSWDKHYELNPGGGAA